MHNVARSSCQYDDVRIEEIEMCLDEGLAPTYSSISTLDCTHLSKLYISEQ